MRWQQAVHFIATAGEKHGRVVHFIGHQANEPYLPIDLFLLTFISQITLPDEVEVQIIAPDNARVQLNGITVS